MMHVGGDSKQSLGGSDELPQPENKGSGVLSHSKGGD